MRISRTIIFGIIFTLSGFSIYSQNSQKGVDTQTQKIKEDSSKTTSRQTDATRSFDWGKGKTKTRDWS
jgi:hypothetical protein